MFEQKVCDDALGLVARFFPEWVELAEDLFADMRSNAGKGGESFDYFSPEKLFAIFITRAYVSQKGARFDCIDEKNREINDYLGAISGSDLSDEEIRWELIDKLGDVD